MNLQVFLTRTPKLVHPEAGLGRGSGVRNRADESEATRGSLHPTTTTDVGGEDVVAGHSENPFDGRGIRGMVLGHSRTQPFTNRHPGHNNWGGRKRPGVGDIEQ